MSKNGTLGSRTDRSCLEADSPTEKSIQIRHRPHQRENKFSGFLPKTPHH